MKKRWISLLVENEVGVLARISGLFSAKSYNMTSLTVGETADETISRMTIGVESDDATFEQIKKQLNRCVEVIEVRDFTDRSVHSREILYIRIKTGEEQLKTDAFRMAQVYGITVADYGRKGVLLECIQTEQRNNEMIQEFTSYFPAVDIVRGGSVAIERMQ